MDTVSDHAEFDQLIVLRLADKITNAEFLVFFFGVNHLAEKILRSIDLRSS
jgi:hypothetical protein